MANLCYTNFQREGAVANMTAKEVRLAERSRGHWVIYVWDHKTANAHGSARIVASERVFEMLQKHLGDKHGDDLVFVTSEGKRVTHIASELQQLGHAFGKKLQVTPTTARKMIATSVGLTGTDAEERNIAKHLTHSIDIHRAAYQHQGKTSESVSTYELLTHHASASPEDDKENQPASGTVVTPTTVEPRVKRRRLFYTDEEGKDT